MIAIISSLAAMAGGNVGAIAAGGTVGTIIEHALPWITRAHRARQLVRRANAAHRRIHGRRMTAEEKRQVAETVDS